MVGKQYEGRVEDYREIAHRFANEVFKTMTGAKGVFDTKIAYVRSDLRNKDIVLADYDGANARHADKLSLPDHRAGLVS